ncbi:unnamed protein product [Clavelina lepadiformis]|uniref:FYVE, RhoGEF and PH domain-containing protein 4 n=1 Tax=Clavelina lepadiformis TaxID=159417 RepID=A0ABP0FAM0_CLALP
MAAWSDISRGKMEQNIPFCYKDTNKVMDLCQALRIYEENMMEVFQKTACLTDNGFAAAHKESRELALQQLGDTPGESKLNAMLSDMIKIKRQRYKLYNSRKLAMESSVSTTVAVKNLIDSKKICTTIAPEISGKSISTISQSNKKLHSIAKEFLSSEQSYVDTLHEIDQVYLKKINEGRAEKDIIPEADLVKIFGHVTAIYQFHFNFLLPQLQKRLENWEENPRIGDVMMQAGPFLKMYTTYTQNFEQASKMLEVWLGKSKDFAALVKSIQAESKNKGLQLQAHLVTPIQRIPRYKLLLENYLKQLPDDAVDRKEAETALDLIADAATHSNDTLKTNERQRELVRKLLDLENVDFDITEVSRNLLKEGSIIKLDDWEDKQYESYLYLLSDMLLDCAPLRNLPLNKSYKVRARIDLSGAQVFEVKPFDSFFGFCVHGTKKSVEFATKTCEERNNWIEAIDKAILECENRRKSFRRSKSFTDRIEPFSNTSNNSPNIKDEEIGKKCPRWIKNREASMCMTCSIPFKIYRRKHHCRACAKIVCDDCSKHEEYLEYIPEEPQKVCAHCWKIISERNNVDAKQLAKNSLLADFVYFSEYSNNKKSCRCWCLVPQNELKLYVFKAPRDIKAKRIIDLKDSRVSCYNECEQRKYCFRLETEQNDIFLATEDKELAQVLLFVLSECTQGRHLHKEDLKHMASMGLALPSPTSAMRSLFYTKT